MNGRSREDEIDRIVTGLAARQHGVVARRQLRDRRVSTNAIARRVNRGRLMAASDRVLRVAGSPADRASQAMAAVLDAGAGAALSHSSAAALWRLPGFELNPVHVTGGRNKARHGASTLATIHEPRRLLPHHVVEVDHVAITTPTRTIFDLAGAPNVNPKRVERLLDTSWSRNLVSHGSLVVMLEELAAKGRSGITLMRSLLADRPASHRPPGSSTESRFQEIAVAAGLRHFERQVDVSDDEAWIGRVDFVDRSRGLIVEVVDALFHGSLTDQRHDERRWRRIEESGWTVEVVDGFDIFHRSDELTTRLRRLALSSGVT